MNITSFAKVAVSCYSYARKSWTVGKTAFVITTATTAATAAVFAGKTSKKISSMKDEINGVKHKLNTIYSDLYGDGDSADSIEVDNEPGVDEGDLIDMGYVPSRDDVDAAT